LRERGEERNQPVLHERVERRAVLTFYVRMSLEK